VVSLTAGTMFLMWLGEQITRARSGQRHLDPDLSRGIAAGLPSAIGGLVRVGPHRGHEHVCRDLDRRHRWSVVTFAVVFVERGQRKILVNYAKRQVGNKVYGGQSSHLPLKLNMSGVIPPIFGVVDHPAAGRRS